MFNKIRNAVLALAAVAALGTATLVTSATPADARGGFHGGSSFRGGSIGMRHIGGGARLGLRHVGGPRFTHLGHRRIHIGHHRPRWCGIWRHRCGVFVRWHRPLVYGAVASYAVAPAVAAAPRPCTCLTKEYTPENLVVFKDVCTKEVASAPQGTTALPLPPANTTYQSQTQLSPGPGAVQQ
jgi:hypothetical protein